MFTNCTNISPCFLGRSLAIEKGVVETQFPSAPFRPIGARSAPSDVVVLYLNCKLASKFVRWSSDNLVKIISLYFREVESL